MGWFMHGEDISNTLSLEFVSHQHNINLTPPTSLHHLPIKTIKYTIHAIILYTPQLHRHQPRNARHVRKIPLRRLRPLPQRLLPRPTRPPRRPLRPTPQLHRQRLLSPLPRSLLPQIHTPSQHRWGVLRHHLSSFVSHDTSWDYTGEALATICPEGVWV